jgi:hypothetical protein
VAVMSAPYALFHSSIIVPSERAGKVFHPLVALGSVASLVDERGIATGGGVGTELW